MPTFTYTVDDEQYSTTEHVLTPEQILQNASLDPNTHYLIQIKGNHQVSYKDNPSMEIHMHENQKFISVSNDPTPVS